MTYSEKLKSPKWQKKRLQILERDEFTCIFCGDKDTELQVHHKEYIKGKEPWEYDDSNFQTVCKHCHEIVEVLKPINVLLTKTHKSKNKDCYILFLFLDREGDKLIGIMRIPFDTEQSEFITVISPGFISEVYEFMQGVQKLKN